MELLGDVGHVEAHFVLFGDSVNLSTRWVHCLCQMHHRLRNHFGRTRWYSNVTRVKWRLVLVHLKIVLTSKQDRCAVCVKHTIGSEISLDAPDGTPWSHG